MAINIDTKYDIDIETPNNAEILKYATSIDDTSELNAKDFIAGASDKDINALATGILDELGIENPTAEMIEDVATLVKIQAKKSTDDVSIASFVSNVITSLQEATGEDSILTEDELETGITQEAKEVLASENAQFASDADTDSDDLYTFLNDILTSINGGNALTADDAPLLNELLGLDDENLASIIIENTDGNIESILEFIASSEDNIE